MLVPNFDTRGSGADREGSVQRGSNVEGGGTNVQRVKINGLSPQLYKTPGRASRAIMQVSLQ